MEIFKDMISVSRGHGVLESAILQFVDIAGTGLLLLRTACNVVKSGVAAVSHRSVTVSGPPMQK